jgi:hypothetical protein
MSAPATSAIAVVNERFGQESPEGANPLCSSRGLETKRIAARSPR